MFLTSNYQPVKTSHKRFPEVFNDLLDLSTSLSIVTGYVSERSIKYLEEYIFSNGRPKLNLIIGMHYFDRFTHSQYAAALELENFLENSELGAVNLVTSFPFHGKLYSFKSESNPACIIGSSNLNNILPHNPLIQYETDILVNDAQSLTDISSFIDRLHRDASQKLSAVDIKDFRQTNNLLEGLSAVQKLEENQVEDVKAKISGDGFKLPLKPYEKAGKSNLHPYLGKGRENTSTGIVLPRSWYEVELIVPKAILDDPAYPEKNSVFYTVTDDGYRFECKTSGDYGKNLRSVDDLKKLGKWIKGRMQNAGVIKAGEKITQETLDAYGRDYIAMYPTSNEKEWFLDFSRGINNE